MPTPSLPWMLTLLILLVICTNFSAIKLMVPLASSKMSPLQLRPVRTSVYWV